MMMIVVLCCSHNAGLQIDLTASITLRASGSSRLAHLTQTNACLLLKYYTLRAARLKWYTLRFVQRTQRTSNADTIAGHCAKLRREVSGVFFRKVGRRTPVFLSTTGAVSK